MIPAVPGFAGESGFEAPTDYLGWLVATWDAIDASGALDDGPVPVVGASVGGMLAAELAALRPEVVAKLVLLAPFGIAGGFAMLNHGRGGPLERLKPGETLIFQPPKTASAAGAPPKAVQAFLRVIAGQVDLGGVAAGDRYDIVTEYRRAETGDVEVGDHTVLHRADGFDIAGRAAQHHARIIADGVNDLASVPDGEGDDRWFVENDISAFGVNERVGRAEINGDIGRECVHE